MKTFVTVLSNDQYLDGVVVLNRSLKAVGSKYPLCCLLSMAVSKESEYRLTKDNISIVRLNSPTLNAKVNGDNQEFSHWNYTFDKLQIWGLTQYEKIVYLDSDMLVVENIDSLFDRPAFSAVCAGKSFPGHKNWKDLNSGLMVILPSNAVKDALLSLVPSVIEEYKSKGLFVGDQDVLHKYLPEWPSMTSLHLDEGYNIFADCLTYYVNKLGYSVKRHKDKCIYIIHFIGKNKPWMRKTLKDWIRFAKMCVRNPYYLWAYKEYRTLL